MARGKHDFAFLEVSCGKKCAIVSFFCSIDIVRFVGVLKIRPLLRLK